jgi:hypothetical protein
MDPASLSHVSLATFAVDAQTDAGKMPVINGIGPSTSPEPF